MENIKNKLSFSFIRPHDHKESESKTETGVGLFFSSLTRSLSLFPHVIDQEREEREKQNRGGKVFSLFLTILLHLHGFPVSLVSIRPARLT